jgi:hypothetical protein
MVNKSGGYKIYNVIPFTIVVHEIIYIPLCNDQLNMG